MSTLINSIRNYSPPMQLPSVATPASVGYMSRAIGVQQPDDRQMLADIKGFLDASSRKHLGVIYENGKLFDRAAEDGQTTLAHLWQIATQQRAAGLNKRVLLKECLRLLTDPSTISQRFAPLHPSVMGKLLSYYNGGNANFSLGRLVTPQDFNDYSATCVSASVMYTLFDKQPSEAIRHIAGLTSDKMGFSESASAFDISPENPALAPQIIQQFKIPAQPDGQGGYRIWVNMPPSALARGLNQQFYATSDSQGVVECLYQAALSKLGAYNYEPGLGTRILPNGQLDQDPGLTSAEKTVMESIMKDNPSSVGPIVQVEYQVTAADRNREAYLLGYNRPFDKILNDLLNTVSAGNHVIIGIVQTDPAGQTAGRLNQKHEVTVVCYDKDSRTGELYFHIADSDDGQAGIERRSAQQLIPQIHHAGLTANVGLKVINEMKEMPNQYLYPDASDAAKYRLIQPTPAERHSQLIAESQQMVMQQNPAQSTPQPTDSQLSPQQFIMSQSLGYPQQYLPQGYYNPQQLYQSYTRQYAA